MPDDPATFELTRYARPIGVAGSWDGETTDSIGVLSPFSGLVDPTIAVGERLAPTFSYLSLQPLVVESIRHEHHETVHSLPEEPKEDETDTPERELRVSHLLERERRHDNERVVTVDTARPSRLGREAPSMAVFDSLRTELQPRQSGADDKTPKRASPDPGPVRDISVFDPTITAVDRTESGVDSRPYTTILAVSSHLDQASERASSLQKTGQPVPMIQAPTVVAAGTGFDGPAPVTPAPVPDAGPSPARTAPPMTVESSPRSHPGQAPTQPRRNSEVDTDRQPSRQPLVLTVVDSAPPPATADAASTSTETHSESRPPGTPFPPPGSDRATVQPDRTATRPTPDPTVTAITADRTEMNRLVDRLYEEVQRKQRVERERRGL